MTVVLPKTIINSVRVDPKRIVLYSKPKAGKTSALSLLENNLILDFENGSDYVDALKIKVNSLEYLKEVGEQIISEGRPYKYISIDTVTALEEMCLGLAKKLYMDTPKILHGHFVRNYN